MKIKNDPLDGVEYINIYSSGKTELGKMLSNFYKQFIETEDGGFQSIEGYWYWLLSSHPQKDILKQLHGYQAKKQGRKLTNNVDWSDSEEFKNKIKKAIEIKISNNKELMDQLIENNLPFVHHYVYGDKIIAVKENKWVNNYIEELSLKIKKYVNR